MWFSTPINQEWLPLVHTGPLYKSEKYIASSCKSFLSQFRIPTLVGEIGNKQIDSVLLGYDTYYEIGKEKVLWENKRLRNHFD